ncbi:hypothetical protein EW146_g3954 [Bondarzewia mesenterica]|uniref:Major facilitator superfamily (MFS) profile domain-containing protein n=1 Tax=Bondarzewia mesenterica TaxID=1095465 RepID=A0A4V3XF99_9AGAM|nr:hypothetical protein EW146_g3954 [Bondarzewia mesenterica]
MEQSVIDVQLGQVAVTLGDNNAPTLSTLEEPKKQESQAVDASDDGDCAVPEAAGPYRLYKRRWLGVLALFSLETVASMSWPWFGPISNSVVTEFGFTLDEVNWLGNIIACIYLPTTFLVPIITRRYGIRRCCEIGAIALIISAWIRYSGTIHTLSKHSAYALIILGQFFSAIAQPVFQVLGPKYSEVWFDLKGRTTATMLIAIANPIGGAIGQLISPVLGNVRHSILILGIISTAVTPMVFLILEKPPVPPTYSGSKKSPSIFSLIKAVAGRPVPPEAYMTPRERVDFSLVVFVFANLLAAINTFSVLSSQWMFHAPIDCFPALSHDITGLMGATLLLAGIVAALATAPLFDRIFTHHLGMTLRILCPIVGSGWFALIWAVKPNDTAGLFVIMAIIGAASVSLLPVGLELGCELTRNADGSSAVLLFFGNLFSIIFLLSQGALRAQPTADPPLHMHRAIIFNAVFVAFAASLVFWLEGRQARREKDEKVNQGERVE